ncbi:MAG: YiiX/YebB-like N1pC/P60 family cysteine hydrolase [Candidatus Thermoplasmatota archaeon]|nr:YiiX/YebB-like N1pC/P60 family cysteine hydrolase [Candidatus Thermoplasmatota archaeon]
MKMVFVVVLTSFALLSALIPANAYPLSRTQEDPAQLQVLRQGDIILFDWLPESELSERMIEHLRNVQRGFLPWDLYGILYAIPTLLTGGAYYLLSTLGLSERSFDMIPGKFDHNALYMGRCSEGLGIAKKYGATGAELRLKEIMDEEGDVPVLIEAANPELGIRILSISEYLEQDMVRGADIAVVRVRGADEKMIEEAIGFALTKCDLAYDMMPFIHGTGGWFDAVIDESAYYCSELAWAAYYYASDGGIDLNAFAFSNPIGCNPLFRANPVLPDEIYHSDEADIILPPKVYIE